jgi:hypothetical protein
MIETQLRETEGNFFTDWWLSTSWAKAANADELLAVALASRSKTHEGLELMIKELRIELETNSAAANQEAKLDT